MCATSSLMQHTNYTNFSTEKCSTVSKGVFIATQLNSTQLNSTQVKGPFMTS